MEKNITSQIKPITTALEQGQWVELSLVVALFVSSTLLGLLLNRWIDKQAHRSWQSKLVDYCGPLLSPLLAVLSCAAAASAFTHYEITPAILPFAIKLAVAWLTIRAVLLISSKKSAGWLIALVVIPVTLLHLFDIWEPLTKLLDSWRFQIGSVKISAYALLKSAVAILVLFWAAGAVTNLVDQQLRRIRSIRASNRVLIMKIFQIVLYFIVFLMVLQVMGINLTALSVFGGALGVGLGFGLQKIASNFISGIILLFEKSMEVDDVVELTDGTMGTIKHTGARYTLIETVDGKEILVPNEDFITQRMTNWTYSSKKARVEIVVGVGYDSDLRRAQAIMVDAAKAHPKCIVDPAPVSFLTQFAESGVELTLYFWIKNITDGRQEPKSDVMLAIWERFKQEGISIPYPRREVHVLHGGTTLEGAL